MSSPQNVLSFNARGDGSAGRSRAPLPEIVRSAKQAAERKLEPLLNGMFNKIDDTLFELADKAESNTQQATYFDAMRDVRLRKSDMLRKFASQYNAGFMETVQSGKAPSSEPATLELALIDEEELEESIAIRNMIDKANELYADPLYCLSQRLDLLLASVELTEENNPFGPAVLCEAFRVAVNTLETALTVKLLVLKLFDKFIIQHLAPVYEAANSALVRGGVLPQLRGRPQPSGVVQAPGRYPGAGRRRMPTAEAPLLGWEQGYGEAVAETVMNQPAAMFELLQQLLAVQRGGVEVAGGPAVPAGTQAPVMLTTVSTDEVLARLSTLQQGAGTAGSVVVSAPAELRAQLLLADDAGQDEREISRAHADVIDVVSMMFDFILDDPDLPDAVKALVARLQIPMIKVALVDREFFGKKSHPARQLLNELAHASIGLDEDAVLSETPMFRKIEEVVGRILREFEEEIDIFAEVLQEIHDLQAQEQEQLAAIQERLEQGKGAAAEAVEQLLNAEVMPERLRSLINGPWREFMAEAHIRNGAEDEIWQKSRGLFTDLVWSIQPKQSAEERSKLVKRIPSLVVGLRSDAVVARLEEEERRQLFSELEALHLASLRPREAAAPVAPSVGVADGMILSAEELDAMMEDKPRTVAEPEVEERSIFDEEIILQEELGADSDDMRWGMEFSGYASVVRGLEVGTWLAFQREGGGMRRGKLAWKSDLMGEYVFVDRFMKVVKDTNLRELVGDMAAGRAQMVEDLPLMDRALDSVMDALKRYREKVAGAPDAADAPLQP